MSKGWEHEPVRHSLSSKGIETSAKGRRIKSSAFMTMESESGGTHIIPTLHEVHIDANKLDGFSSVEGLERALSNYQGTDFTIIDGELDGAGFKASFITKGDSVYLIKAWSKGPEEDYAFVRKLPITKSDFNKVYNSLNEIDAQQYYYISNALEEVGINMGIEMGYGPQWKE